MSSLNGDKEQSKKLNRHAGIIGSAFEGFALDQLFGNNIGDAVSAVRIIDLANSQNIPVHFINSENIIDVLPNLNISSDIINDIQNAVNAGMVIIVPGENIEHNGWVGSGYIVTDPDTGNGGYIIEGGTAGGYMIKAHLSCMPLAEPPDTSNFKSAIEDWANSIGPVAIAEASGPVEVAIGTTLGEIIGVLIGEALALAALLVATIIIVAKLIDVLTRELPIRRWRRFRHYTSFVSLEKIITSGYIGAFSVPDGCLADFTKNYDYNSAYITDLFLEPDYPPITDGNSKIIKETLGFGSIEKAATYVEFMLNVNKYLVEALSNLERCPFQYVYPFPIPLYSDPDNVTNVRFYKRIQ